MHYVIYYICITRSISLSSNCIFLMLVDRKSTKILHLWKSTSSSFRIEMLAHLTSERL